MQKLCFEAGETPVGGSKRSANASQTRSRHVSRSAGFCEEVSSSCSIILSIRSQIMTIWMSEDLHLATKNAETKLISDLRATALQ